MNDRTGSDDGGETALIGLGLFAIALGGAHWAAINLAAMLSGRPRPTVGLGQALAALPHLPSHLSDPRLAWPAMSGRTLPPGGATRSP